MLDLYHRMFVRAGARLAGADRARYAEIAQRLATLGTAFSQNVRADEKAWTLPLAAADLEGPAAVPGRRRGAGGDGARACRGTWSRCRAA